jgi:hypothetical protein
MTIERLEELLITKQDDIIITLLNISPTYTYKSLGSVLAFQGDGSLRFKKINADAYEVYRARDLNFK